MLSTSLEEAKLLAGVEHSTAKLAAATGQVDNGQGVWGSPSPVGAAGQHNYYLEAKRGMGSRGASFPFPWMII